MRLKPIAVNCGSFAGTNGSNDNNIDLGFDQIVPVDRTGSEYIFIRGEGMSRLPDAEVLLTPREVADLFGVDPKTVTRWAKAGKLTSIRTLGGHRRYRKSEVDDLRANYFKAQ